MDEHEEQEYSYREVQCEATMIPQHNTSGSPRFTSLGPHYMPSTSGYSRVEQNQRGDDYSIYRVHHPVSCDSLPPVAHYNPTPYHEYILAHPSHYQHVRYNSWPYQEAFHYRMPSGEICQPFSSIAPDPYFMEDYSAYQRFQNANVLEPVQVACNVNSGGHHCSPDYVTHTLRPEVSVESTSVLSVQSWNAEEHSFHGEDTDVGNPEITMSSHQTSVNSSWSLSSGSFVSKTIVDHEEVVQTKGCKKLKWENSRRPCNCTKSQCLKLYCECFASGELCKNCKCVNCFNNTEHAIERSQAVMGCLIRNPRAFHPKIGIQKQGDVKGCHTKGCNCKRSGCLKNYCECYEAKIMCSSNCKCVGCRNYESPDKRSKQEFSIYHPTRSPLTCITPDVVEATCGCLLAKAEESEKEGLSAPHAERMILEEFGQCLTQIVRSIFKSTGVQHV